MRKLLQNAATLIIKMPKLLQNASFVQNATEHDVMLVKSSL